MITFQKAVLPLFLQCQRLFAGL